MKHVDQSKAILSQAEVGLERFSDRKGRDAKVDPSFADQLQHHLAGYNLLLPPGEFKDEVRLDVDGNAVIGGHTLSLEWWDQDPPATELLGETKLPEVFG